MKWPVTPDLRRAWAFGAIVGACIVFTAFAAFGVYTLRKDPEHSFLLAVLAHVQVLVGLTALGALLVRRTIKISRDGIDLSDNGGEQ